MRQLMGVDWFVFASVLVISVGIGVASAIFQGGPKTPEEYFVGGRKLWMIPVALSIFMSFVSAINIMGNTAEVYLYGTQIYFGNVFTFMAYIIAAFVFAPTLYRLKLTTIFQYVDLRFSSTPLRILLAIIQLIASVVYMGIVIFAPAIAFEAVTGFPTWASIVIAGIMTSFYTAIGGMRAVIWTDVFQGLFMFAGLIAIIVLGTQKVGGTAEVWNISKNGGRHVWFNLDPDPRLRMNLWSLMANRIFLAVPFGCAQEMLQRYSSVASLRQAQLSLLMNIPLVAVILTLTVWGGLVMYSYFDFTGCDPLASRKLLAPNQVFPYFVVMMLDYPGVPGAFLAVLFCGAMSTVSSTINGLSAITWKDIVEPYFKVKGTRRTHMLMILVFIFGAATIGAAFMIKELPGHIGVITIQLLGGLSSPIPGVMVLGLMVPCANALGALFGAVTAFALTSWINVGSFVRGTQPPILPLSVDTCVNYTMPVLPVNRTVPEPSAVDPLYDMSFLLVSVVGLITCVVVGTFVSIISGGSDETTCRPEYVVMLQWASCGRRRPKGQPDVEFRDPQPSNNDSKHNYSAVLH